MGASGPAGLMDPFQNSSGTAELLPGPSSLRAGGAEPQCPAWGQCHTNAMGNGTIPIGHRAFWGTHCSVPKDGGVNHSGKCGEQPFGEE